MEEMHMCMKAPTDFLAWKKLEPNEKCRYCGYVEADDSEEGISREKDVKVDG